MTGSPDVVERWPQLHFPRNWFGNYVACNQYWEVGLECPHHDESLADRKEEREK